MTVFDPASLEKLQERLTYQFRNPALLERALTHLSYLQDNPEVSESNQRLEFLGDAVLQLLLSQTLFELYPGDREGLLSRRRAALSKGSFLAGLARELGLSSALRVGSSEESSGGRERNAALEDAFEAVVGALFLDSDYLTCRRLVLGIYGDLPSRLLHLEDEENPKGRLQELIQPLHGNQALRYEVLEISGSDHARSYEMGVFLLERQLGSGKGPSKKLAEEAAARRALDTLREDGLEK